MAKTNPFEFLQQVREEANKVTWPTRREVMISTAMVFIMVALASVFFLIVEVSLMFQPSASEDHPSTQRLQVPCEPFYSYYYLP